MHPKITIIIAVIVWALAMARLLPRAWRLDKSIQRRHRSTPPPAPAPMDRTFQALSPQKAGT